MYKTASKLLKKFAARHSTMTKAEAKMMHGFLLGETRPIKTKINQVTKQSEQFQRFIIANKMFNRLIQSGNIDLLKHHEVVNLRLTLLKYVEYLKPKYERTMNPDMKKRIGKEIAKQEGYCRIIEQIHRKSKYERKILQLKKKQSNISLLSQKELISLRKSCSGYLMCLQEIVIACPQKSKEFTGDAIIIQEFMKEIDLLAPPKPKIKKKTTVKKLPLMVAV